LFFIVHEKFQALKPYSDFGLLVFLVFLVFSWDENVPQLSGALKRDRQMRNNKNKNAKYFLPKINRYYGHVQQVLNLNLWIGWLKT